MLDYVVRIRDLVHGFVYLTKAEVSVINHPLFQRLRQIRQNDVAFYVYPSLNISRFEHSLGCSHVAGKMAENLSRGADWTAYTQALDLSPEQLVQVARLYALLHDVGHLPLSHLFEIAFEDHVYATGDGSSSSIATRCKEWFGGAGFTKLHEACGAAVAPQILRDAGLPASIMSAVLQLMSTKSLASSNPLRPIKLLVDSDIDADRIDATARDGHLAGQEYGNYDIERLCSSVFVQKRQNTWRLAYSHKALGSIEGLLLDRCRTHTWIHFHHRVVAMKVAARFLIAKLLETGVIGKSDFPVSEYDVMALRDDIWLWQAIRAFVARTSPSEADGALSACRDALLYRKSGRIVPLWKNRTEYREVTQPLMDQLKRSAVCEGINPRWLGRDFEKDLSTKLGVASVVHWLKFSPVTRHSLTPLTDEHGSGDRGHLLDSSPLVDALAAVWSGEPGFYVVLLGDLRESLDTLRQRWRDVTFEWVQRKVNAQGPEQASASHTP